MTTVFLELILVHTVAKVAHFDIKPENILTNKEGEVKIADFGMAQVLNPDAELTKIGGTRLFQSPEAWNKKGSKGRAIDIWALGVTFYFLAFCKYPFFSRDREKLKNLIFEKEPSFPEGADPGLINLLRRCLDKNAEKRITLPELQKDKWLTKGGTCPLVPEKLRELNLSKADLDNAVTQIILETNVFAVSKMRANLARKRTMGKGALLRQPTKTGD